MTIPTPTARYLIPPDPQLEPLMVPARQTNQVDALKREGWRETDSHGWSVAFKDWQERKKGAA